MYFISFSSSTSSTSSPPRCAQLRWTGAFTTNLILFICGCLGFSVSNQIIRNVVCVRASRSLSPAMHTMNRTHVHYSTRTNTPAARERERLQSTSVYNMDTPSENVAYERIIPWAGARFRLKDRVHFTLCYLRDVDDDGGNDDDQNIPYRHQDTEETDGEHWNPGICIDSILSTVTDSRALVCALYLYLFKISYSLQTPK